MLARKARYGVVLLTTAGTAIALAEGPLVEVEHVQVNLGLDLLDRPGDAANEPSIAVDPTAPNRIAIAWRHFDTVLSDFRQAGFSWSTDGGRTWSPLGIIRPDRFRSDPVLGADRFGRFHLMSLQARTGGFRVLHHRSEDGGQTWSDAVNATGGDKEWLAVHPNGEVLFHHWTGGFNRSFSGGVFPTGEGPAWGPVYEIRAEAGVRDEPFAGTSTVGPDGALYVAGSSNAQPGAVLVIRSDNPLAPDGAFRFDLGVAAPMNGDTSLFNLSGPNPVGLMGQTQVVTNHAPGQHHGEVYVLTTIRPSDSDDPSEVRFVRSADRGETWSAPVRVHDDPEDNDAWQWFGTLSIAPGGRLDAVWLDTRNDPDQAAVPILSELHYTFSHDGGRTWSPDVRLSEAFDSNQGFPIQQKMGDYFHMVSDDLGADLAWCATFGGEQNVYYTRIGPRDCDRNGVADRDDAASGLVADCDGDAIPDRCEAAAGDAPPCFCVADFAIPFGVLDLADISGFVGAFTAGDGAADLAEPPGVLDLSDLTTFIAGFIGGCP